MVKRTSSLPPGMMIGGIRPSVPRRIATLVIGAELVAVAAVGTGKAKGTASEDEAEAGAEVARGEEGGNAAGAGAEVEAEIEESESVAEGVDQEATAEIAAANATSDLHTLALGGLKELGQTRKMNGLSEQHLSNRYHQLSLIPFVEQGYPIPGDRLIHCQLHRPNPWTKTKRRRRNCSP